MTHFLFNRSALTSALVLALIAPNAVFAAEQDDKQKADKEKEEERVLITGSRIKRVDTEGAAPVQVLTGQQIQAEGFLTVYDALTTINEAIGTVESDVQWGSHTPNASPINLRNMGPGRSLLLVNGRRVADYPLPYGGQSNFSNYSAIPSAAVERIEILTGGASAIYGSDAVAGVINVILKKNYQGDQGRIRVGEATEGGREAMDLSWAGGRAGDRWSVTYALQHTERDPLFGRDRPKMDDSDDAPRSSWNPEQIKVGFRPFTGLALINAGNNNRIRPPDGTCEKFDGEFYLANRLTYNYAANTINDTGWLCGKTRDFGDWLLMSGSEDNAGYVYATFDFSDSLQGFANLSVYQAEAEWSTSPPGAQLMVNHGSVWWDADLNAPIIGVRNFTPKEVGGYDGMRNFNDELSVDLSAGLKGTMMGGAFDWEASVGRSEYTVDEDIAAIDPEKVDKFFLGQQLGTQNGLPVYRLNKNLWWNPLTPAQYSEFGLRSKNSAESWVNQANFMMSGDLLEAWAGPIGFAGVFEYAKQGYELNPDPNAGDLFGPQNVDRGGGERARYSLGVELNIPLLETLEASVAARRDRYGDYEAYKVANALDVGTQQETTWNLGLQWRPSDDLLVRGTFATSFRAPDMHFLLAQPSSFAVSTTDPYRCINSGDYLTNNCGNGTQHYYAFNINRRGTPDLRSEIGESWTIGYVWNLMQDLSLTMDYWSIDLEDEIRDISEGQILRDEAGCRTGKTTDPNRPWANPGGAEYCDSVLARVTRGADGRIVAVERGPINIAEKHVEGIDMSLRYALKTTAFGDFRFGLNYTNLQSLKEQTYRTDPNPERRGRDVRSKLRLHVGWELDDWNVNLYGDRIGSVPGVRFHWDPQRGVSGGCTPFPDGHVPSDNPDYDCEETNPNNPNYGKKTSRYTGRVGPSVTWNLNVGYKVTADSRVNVYVNNLLNQAGWNNKDPYKLDYEFYNSRLFNPVGREVAVEYIHNF